MLGDSNRSRKNYSRYAMTSWKVQFNVPAAKQAKTKQVPIIWINDDEEGVLYLYEDALVISTDIVGKKF